MQRRSFLLVSVIALSMLSTLQAHAASSSLDTTCNTVGTREDFLGANDVANGIARQSDGKIVEAGFSDGAAGNYDFTIVRFNTDCSNDTTFGSLDSCCSPLTLFRMDISGRGTNDGAFAVAVQPDGKIVAAGYREIGNDDVVVVRLNPDGTLDDTFDGDGVATFAIAGNERATALAIQPNGHIVVAGWSDGGGNRDSLLARFNPNGSLDQLFNGTGWKLYDNGATFNDEFTGVQVQTDGNIVASGWRNNGTDDDIVLMRTKPNGLLDAGFASGGLYFQGASSNERATGLVLDSLGRAIYSATTDIAGSNDFYVERLTTAGILDVFNTVDFGSLTNDQAFAIARQPDGMIVVGGQSGGAFAVARFTSTLVLDSGFGSAGVVTTPIDSPDQISGLLVQPDGRIVASGTSGAFSPNFAIARYQGSPVISFSSAIYSVSESAGTATITLQRAGATQDAVSANVLTTAGTATPGSDYTTVSTTVPFPAGATTATFAVPIANDTAIEGPETINLSLTGAGGAGNATLGQPSAALLTINASDQKVDALVKFQTDSSYLGNNIYNSTGATQTKTVTGFRGSTRKFYAEIQNDGNVVNTFKIKGGASPAGFIVRYFLGTTSTQITSSVLAGTYSTGNLAIGAVKLIRIEITVKPSTPGGTVGSVPVRGTWTGDIARIDVARANVRVL